MVHPHGRHIQRPGQGPGGPGRGVWLAAVAGVALVLLALAYLAWRRKRA